MSSSSWICPFCNRPTTVTENDIKKGYSDLLVENADGERRLIYQFIVCPNPDCKKITLKAWLHERAYDQYQNAKTGKMLKYWSLIPASNAKPFPEYIPAAIISDYNEACAIKDLSPKASATLSRRCLQGILRDFWGVKPRRLVEEIDEIKGKVDPLTWDAIDSVRGIGNIGAHMEKDINLIIDVEPQEAQLLIGLIEILIKDWYIAKHEREKHLKDIIAVAEQKEDGKKPDKENQSPTETLS